MTRQPLKTHLLHKHAPHRRRTIKTATRTIHTLMVCLCLGLALGACSDDPTEPPPAAPNNDPGNNDPNNDIPPLTGEMGLQVGNEAARSCEVMLTDPGKVLGALSTDDTVEGRALRQGDQIALAFAQASDASVVPNAVRFALAGTIDGVAIDSVTCFDRAGQPLADPAVELLSSP